MRGRIARNSREAGRRPARPATDRGEIVEVAIGNHGHRPRRPPVWRPQERHGVTRSAQRNDFDDAAQVGIDDDADFLAAQIEAYLADDLWLELARHANAMADRLAAGLTAANLVPVWPVEANEVFVALPSRLDARLKAEGASYYPWTTESLPKGVALERDATLVRLVTSFATSPEEVDRFVELARAP